jgi:hypothetical protein
MLKIHRFEQMSFENCFMSKIYRFEQMSLSRFSNKCRSKIGDSEIGNSKI